ncbi:MAG: 23S rRNA (guanosine2251-2'-O)-methyltransferase [Planctomycetota bacterium]|jgi:23S rRNA (guanosine2251-2'-O)-methyltransferase
MNDTLIYGFHAVSKRLQKMPQGCLELLCQQKRNARLQSVIDLASQAAVPVKFESRETLTQLCGSAKHQDCVLRIDAPSVASYSFNECLQKINPESLFLILDGVQDPHNLGACLRTADACGVDAVIIPSDRAVQMNATVRKVAAGGAETVPLVEVTNIARSMRELQQAGVWIVGTSGDASDSLYDFSYTGPIALAMGSEGDGLRRLTLEACDYRVKLPMQGAVESLNVSVATGICLYEILRSRASAKSDK